jgi:hypothetical protein
MRTGWFSPVHVKSREAQTLRVLLAGRKAMLGKVLDMENMTRGLIRPFGLKLGAVSGLGAEAYTSISRPDRVGATGACGRRCRVWTAPWSRSLRSACECLGLRLCLRPVGAEVGSAGSDDSSA